MSRTKRTLRKTAKTVRDGSPQRVDSSCNNHGGCPHCESNRLIRAKRLGLRGTVKHKSIQESNE